MAEALAKSILRNNTNIKISSAGVSTRDGYLASENAIAALLDEEIDLISHSSRQISSEMLKSAKLVLTMTQGHLHAVKILYPQANAYTLGEYADTTVDISDPFGGNLETYRKCMTQIKQLLLSSVEKLQAEFQ